MFEQSSRSLTLLSYSAGATTALLLCTLGFQQWDTARWEARQRVEQQESTFRSNLVAAYLTSLRDVETGQRGYLVTADPAFLQPLQKALETLPKQGASIEKTFAGSGNAPALARQLVLVGTARTARAMRSVSLVGEGKSGEARALVAEGTGKRLMDRARALAGQINDKETSSARARQDAALSERAERQRNIYFLEIATLISLAFLVYALAKLLGNLRRTSRTLRDSAARQSAIFEGATDSMMMLDANGIIESANSATEKLFGFASDELVGQSNLKLFKTPPTQEVSQAYLARLANGEERDQKQIFEGCRKDRTSIEAEVVTTPIKLEDGLHFLAVLRDATERRQIERMKSEFVATVSHELRTPLTSIAGSLGLILGGAAGEISEKSSRLVQIAKNNCDRLIRLINDMLDIEKIESGQAQLSILPIDVGAAVAQAMASIEGLAREHQIRIDVSHVRPDLQVLADADRLTQILTNLVSNAVKFSPAGSEVRVAAEPTKDREVVFSVADDGPGISDEFRQRIFQKFAQADSTDSRLKGGTGLGLSIVKELVERMDGKVDFTSDPGSGTTFTFTLPLSSGAHWAGLSAASLGRMEQDDSFQILHVDDDADTLRLVASAFEGRASVHSSPSFQEAKAALERYDFDALVLDISMPDGDGLELINLAKTREGSETPVVLYTALDAAPGAQSPVFARLTKTKDGLDTLVETVEAAAKRGKSTGHA